MPILRVCGPKKPPLLGEMIPDSKAETLPNQKASSIVSPVLNPFVPLSEQRNPSAKSKGGSVIPSNRIGYFLQVLVHVARCITSAAVVSLPLFYISHPVRYLPIVS